MKIYDLSSYEKKQENIFLWLNFTNLSRWYLDCIIHESLFYYFMNNTIMFI